MSPPAYSRRRPKNLWFERLMATIAVVNLALILFDVTYVPWRNFWLQGNIVLPLVGWRIQVPLPEIQCRDRSVETGQPPRQIRQSAITCLYDPVKGIEPHRDTQFYLSQVQTLEQLVNQKGVENGLSAKEAQDTLANLRQLSVEMINTNPFALANKTGTLERIKNLMRGRVRRATGSRVSAKEAFERFWSTNYLTPTNWNQEMAWFNQEIKPLMETNYFRGIGENGELTNNFWMVDAPFVTLFFLEFLARTFYMSHISRRYAGLRWVDAMFWRWYDVLLFLPFGVFAPILALSRVIPTTIRLHQAHMIDLHELQTQVRRGFVADIAGEMTEVMVVQILNQVQESIRRGELAEWLQRTGQKDYVDLNNINEVEAIARHLVDLSVNHVFPKIQPDVEALLRQSINSVLSQSPAYRGLQSIPGIGAIPNQITDRLVSDMTQMFYTSTKATMADPAITELTVKLVQNIGKSIVTEARQQNTLPELQSLIIDLIEEVKINYVQRFAEEGIDLVLNQTRQLQRLPKQD
jgi:hypothetical protein